MNGVLDTIFGLTGLGFGDEGVVFGWARPIPAWAWALVVAGAIALGTWSYAGLTGARRWRAVFGAARAVLLILLVVVICGPRLERPRTSVQQDHVVVLLDRSQSMTLPDETVDGARAPRDDALRRALDDSAPVWDALAADRAIRWLGFAGGAFDAGVDESGNVDPGAPDGRRTAIGAALDGAVRASAGVPVSGIVIFSDGRSADEPSPDTVRRLVSDQVPVFVVPLGAEDAPADVAVARVEAPRQAFVDDTVPVRVDVAWVGDFEGSGPVIVELVDSAGVVLDRAEATPSESGHAEVIVRTTPRDAGERALTARVRAPEGDLVATNDARTFELEMVDRPLRCLYLEGYPRWEQRYLKNLLLRERSISSSNLLLSSARQYLQEGDVLVDGVPTSPGEWGEYDVIVMGDVRADLLSEDQIEQIREHVSDRGAGLLWIAGPGSVPGTWAGTALADLIPFALGTDAARAAQAWDQPVTLIREDAGERLGLLALGDDGRSWPERLVDPGTGWSRLRWAQRLDPERLKPTAEVFASALPVGATSRADATPAVVSMRYGAGRVVYVATDETWRWRYGRGEALTERFWLPIVRLLGRSSLARTGGGAVLSAEPSDVTAGRPVQVRLDLFDQALLEAAPAGVRVSVRRAGRDPREIRLSRDEGARAGRFDATWAADEPGEYEIRVDEPILAGLALSVPVSVRWADDELRAPEADHELLRRLADETGGAVLTPGSLSRLPELLPNRQLVIAGEPEVSTLWDRPVVLAAFLVLLTFEWVGRRLVHLV